MDNLQLQIEALIFAATIPIPLKEIHKTIEDYLDTKVPVADLERAVEDLIQKFQEEHFAIEIVEIADGFTFMTKGAFHNVIGTYLKQVTNKKLSKAAMETLSIIAYKQPVSKAEMESIRGVNCDYSVQKLLEKELIEILGRSDSLGRPLLYGTSEKFKDYFGLRSLEDLPQLKEIEAPENHIGIPESLEVKIPVPKNEEQ
jgi:segregation and condensation protein B